MRALLSALLLATLLFSCGQDGENNPCPDCPKPENPRPPKPVPPEEVDRHIVCETTWELSGEPAGRAYFVSYAVTRTKSGETIAQLATRYRTANSAQAQQIYKATYPKGEGAEARVKSMMFDVSLSADEKKATIKRVPFQDAREALCRSL